MVKCESQTNLTVRLVYTAVLYIQSCGLLHICTHLSMDTQVTPVTGKVATRGDHQQRLQLLD